MPDFIFTYTPLRIATHEWAALWQDLRHAPDWTSRWGCLFGPPGYSHDGSRRTSEELRQQRAQQRQK